MTTIDQLLTNITTHTSPTLEEIIPSRDAKVLRSLTTGINSQQYITENQSKLAINIIRENSKKLSEIAEDIVPVLQENKWLRIFRIVEQVRKFYISKDVDKNLQLTVDFTFSSSVRKNILQTSKNIEGLTQTANGKLFSAALTEKNIVVLYEILAPLGFDIDPVIKTHYKTIKSWSKDEVTSQFFLENMPSANFQTMFNEDLGDVNATSKHILTDRSKRYQYFYNPGKNTEKSGENLTEIISHRTRTKLWIDNKVFSLDDIFQSLIELNRLPVMIVFDNYNGENSVKILENLSKSLEKFSIDDNVGIYFRLPNHEHGEIFNKFIADKKYNQYLNDQTKVVGVQGGKIPKFFINNEWKPMSVLVIDTNLRHTKTAVYANCCDLIITYSEAKPLMDIGNAW